MSQHPITPTPHPRAPRLSRLKGLRIGVVTMLAASLAISTGVAEQVAHADTTELTVAVGSPAGTLAEGEVLTYPVTVTNPGTDPTTTIEVTSSLTAATVSCPQTDLAAGASMSCEVTYTLTAADMATPTLDQTITASGTTNSAGGGCTPAPLSAPVLGSTVAYTYPSGVQGWQATVDYSDAGGNPVVSAVFTVQTAVTSAPRITLDGDKVIVYSNFRSSVAATVPGYDNEYQMSLDLITGPGASVAGNTMSWYGHGGSAGKFWNNTAGFLPNGTGTVGDITLVFENTQTFVGGADVGDTLTPGTAYSVNDPNGQIVAGEAPGYIVDYAFGDMGENQTTTSHFSALGGRFAIESYAVNISDGLEGCSSAGGTVVDGEATTSTPLWQPAITVDKSDPVGTLAAGETVTYDIEVSNTGNIEFTDIAIDDPLTADESCPSTTLAAGSTMTCTATYQVTQADVDAGTLSNTASVTGNLPDGSSGPTGTDTATVSIAATPALTVTKSASPADAGAGETINYTFMVTNTGNVTLDPIVVDDALTDDESCPPGPLAPGASVACTATYTVTIADVQAGDIENTAIATGTTPTGGSTSGLGSNVYDVPQNPSMTVSKSGTLVDADGDGIPASGDYINYTFVVTNDGNVTLTGLALTDPATGPVTCDVTTLAPGEVATCTSVGVVTQAAIDAGTLANTAQAVAKDPAGNDVTKSGSTDTALVRAPQLTVTKSALESTPFAGDTIHYTIVVVNSGNVTIDNITVADPLTDDESCPQTSLLPGEQMDCTATYVISQAELDAGLSNTATATGTGPDGGEISGQGTTTTPYETAPAIEASKSGVANDANLNGVIEAGESIDYVITVTNTGNQTVSDVAVSDPLADGAVTCTPTTLAPGAVSKCSFSYVILQTDINAGNVPNTATADANDPSGAAVAQQGASTDTALAPVPRVAVEKDGELNDANGDDVAQAGETIDYTITVSNTGNLPITDIVVSDPLVSSVNCDIAAPITLQPGKALTCTASYTLTEADIVSGSVGNTASVTGTDPNGGAVNGEDSTATSVPAVPELTLGKVGTPQDENGDGNDDVGETIGYTVTVENTGNVTMSNIVVSDPKVPGMTCDVTTLAVGQTATCTGTYTLTQADIDNGSVANTAKALGTDPSGTTVSGQGGTDTALPAASSMTVSKSGTRNDENGDGVDQVGETITYTIVVDNTGNVTIDNLAVADPTAGTPTCDATTLAPGERATCTVTYTLTANDVDAGQIDNTATVTGTEPSGTQLTPVEGSTTTALPHDPGLTLAKTGTPVDGNGDEYVTAGETVDYEFVITNTGNVTMTGISIDDPLTGGANCPATTLLAGASMTCTASYTVTETDDAANVVHNTATVTGTDPSSNSVTGEGSTSTALPSAPELAVVKQAALIDTNDDQLSQPGETIDYTITVTNVGPVAITDITVSDPMLPGLGCGPFDLEPGASTSCTASYALTQADIDSGTIVNTAKASGEAPDGSPVTAQGSVTTMTEAGPEVTVTKSASYDKYIAGEVISYTIVVHNTGNVTVSNISIDDQLTTDESCPANALAPGQLMECTATYTITDDDVTNTTPLVNTANVSAVTATGTAVEGSGSAKTPFAPLPALSTAKSSQVNNGGDDVVDAGDTIDYTIIVSNIGNVVVSDVVVTDALVPDLTCDATAVAPGARITCTGTYTLTQADVDAGTFVNQVDVNGTDPSGGVVTSTGTDTATLPADAGLSVVKSASHDDANNNGVVDVGERFNYEITVTNTGNATVSGITVDDPLTSDEACPKDVLAPGEATVCTATYALEGYDIDVGSVKNTASATGTDPSGTEVSSAGEVETSIEAAPSLAVLKSAASPGLVAGEVIDYTITVVNNGNVTMFDITLDDPLTDDEECPSDALAVNESMICTATYTATDADVLAGEVLNTATAKGTGPDGTSASGSGGTAYPFDPAPSVETAKSGVHDDANGNGLADVGEVINYTITVSNTGNVDLYKLTVDDPLTGSPACAATVLAKTESVECLVSYALTQADIDAGSVDNTATASATDPDGTVVSGGGSTTNDLATDSGFEVEKSGSWNDLDDDGTVDPGETIDYTITVTNTGNVTLADLVVSDPKAGDPYCDVTTLAPGETATCTVAYTIGQADADSGRIDNLASVSATSPDGESVTGQGSTTQLVEPMPALDIQKSHNGSELVAGVTVDYSIRVENTGNVTITGITVDDPLTSDESCPGTELGAGESMVCTATYVVTADDFEAGAVENTASATGTDPNGVETSGSGSVTFAKIPNPALTVTKVGVANDVDNDGTFEVGETIDYTIEVDNTGNMTVVDISVTDALTAPPDCPFTELASGASMTCTVSYTLTQADVDAGEVINTVQVSSPTLSVPATGSTTTDLPAATVDTVAGQAGQQVSVDVLGNDRGDLDESSLRLVDSNGDLVTSMVVPGEGTWVVEGGELVFNPEPGFVGTTTPARYSVATVDGVVVSSSVSITYTEQSPATADAAAAAATVATAATAATGASAAAERTTGVLPRTGVNTFGAVLPIACLLLAFGTLLMATGRRRRTA